MKEASEPLLQLVTTSQELPELPQAEDPGDLLVRSLSSPFGDIFFLPLLYHQHLCFSPGVSVQ